MESATPSEPRLRALLEAGLALASELSLDSLLQRLTEPSAELTDARYAALGVIDTTGSNLERFITHGLDESQRAAIGEPPHGRGIARRADHGCLAAAPARDRRRPALGRLPAQSPADDELPRRAGAAARDGLRQPLPDREAGWGRLHPGGPGARRAARLAGGRRDRERATVRIGHALVAAARVTAGGQQRDGARDVGRPPARADRGAAPRPAGGAARDGRAAGGPGARPDRRGGRRAGGRGDRRAAAAPRVEDGARAGAPPQRACRLGARRPRGRPRLHAPRRRPRWPLGAAARPGPPDRRDLGLRQALGSGRPLHRRRRAPRRDLRHPRGRRGRALGARGARRAAPGRLGPGARAPAPRA